MMKLVIGTRGSKLALWQARHVASLIEKGHPHVQVQLEIIKTKGDKITDAPLAVIGGKGLFTKEIEDALLDGRVDLAVHSMKDLPTEIHVGLKLAAVMEREDPRDVFVSRDECGLNDLGPGARIGTSSLRRRAFLLNRITRFEVVPTRGNVDTRLKKIRTENLAGAVLAAAGIKRMGLESRVTHHVEPEFMIPAIGQGALGVEVRLDDPDVETVVSPLNHKETALCVEAERAFLRRMGGGCQVPMAAHAAIISGRIEVTAAVVHPDGIPMIRETITGDPSNSQLGVHLAEILMDRGAVSIVKSVLGKDWKPGPGV
jgi:hydroxymethylbilane synthase